MAKKVAGFVKLQIPAGKANPAPPVGTALGPQGINIMAFCKEFNSRTQGQDTILPVEITIYSDKSFTFITKTPPAAVLLKKEAGIEKGSGQPNRNKVGKVTKAQVRKIAELKFPGHVAVGVVEIHRMFADDLLQVRFVAVKVTERFGVVQCKLKRLDGLVEAQHSNRAGHRAGGAQHGDRVGRRAQANVPDNEITGMSAQAFDQAQLSDVERLRFRHRADHRMKRLSMAERMHTVDTVRQPDDFVPVGSHDHANSRLSTGGRMLI